MNKNIKETVYKILRENKNARYNDNILILKVVQEIEPSFTNCTFENVMQKIQAKGISFEGITRARRKFFEENPEYRDRNIDQIRRKKEREYFEEYSKHIPRID